MFNVAVLYNSGRRGLRRADLAALWYGRAAASGHACAQFDPGQLYGTGDGVPRIPDQAASRRRAALMSAIAGAGDRTGRRPTQPGRARRLPRKALFWR